MLITHDLGVIAEMADEVVVMYAGRVIEKGTAREIFHNPLHPYTIGLQKSKPLIISNSNEPLYSIPGQVPNPINLPNACYFKSRCSKCINKCNGEYPREIKVSDTHSVSCYLYEESEVGKMENNTDKKYILEVKNLSKYFPIATNFFGKPTCYLKAVNNVSFSLEKGKTIGVVGESGCGKTTLGRTILKLYEPNEGQIIFDGHDITKISKNEMRKYRTSMQLIFQDPYSSLPPRMTVGSIISEAVIYHNIVPKEQVNEYVRDIMKKCGLQPQYYDRYPHEFSGGQRQRICIARALAVNPKLVICDEPVSALDVSIQAQIINLLKELQLKLGLTYVFISHDLSVVKYITDQILVMYLGNTMELGDTDEIFDNPLHPYTQALFSAVPVPDPDVKMNRII